MLRPSIFTFSELLSKQMDRYNSSAFGRISTYHGQIDGTSSIPCPHQKTQATTSKLNPREAPINGSCSRHKYKLTAPNFSSWALRKTHWIKSYEQSSSADQHVMESITAREKHELALVLFSVSLSTQNTAQTLCKLKWYLIYNMTIN